MIVAAGTLVLLGLAMFVAGFATGLTLFFWGCVAVCAVAAVLLVLARRQLTSRGERRDGKKTAVPANAAAAPESGRTTAAASSTTGAPAARADRPPTPTAAAAGAGEPPLEEVEVTDLLLIVDLKEEVLVVDEHPRYHLPGCRTLAGREAIPLPLDEARTDGFTPCGICAPDRTLAERERARK